MGATSGNISDLNLKEGSILENAYRYSVTAHSVSCPDSLRSDNLIAKVRLMATTMRSL